MNQISTSTYLTLPNLVKWSRINESSCHTKSISSSLLTDTAEGLAFPERRKKPPKEERSFTRKTFSDSLILFMLSFTANSIFSSSSCSSHSVFFLIAINFFKFEFEILIFATWTWIKYACVKIGVDDGTRSLVYTNTCIFVCIHRHTSSHVCVCVCVCLVSLNSSGTALNGSWEDSL